jgi:hypothetical protein
VVNPCSRKISAQNRANFQLYHRGKNTQILRFVLKSLETLRILEMTIIRLLITSMSLLFSI